MFIFGINLLITCLIFALAVFADVVNLGNTLTALGSIIAVVGISLVFVLMKIFCTFFAFLFASIFDQESPEESYRKQKKTSKFEMVATGFILYIGALAALLLTGLIASAILDTILIRGIVANALLAIPLAYFFFMPDFYYLSFVHINRTTRKTTGKDNTP